MTLHQYWIRVYSHKTHNFDFYHHDGTALFLPVILVSLNVVALLALALLAAFVSVVAVVLFLLLFALCLLPFCVTTAPTYQLFRNQTPIPFSVGSSKQEAPLTQDPHPVDRTLSALKAMPWTASLPFNGLRGRQVGVIKSWIYSWMCQWMLFQDKYEM
jgi:hypothetical protein